MTRKRLMMAIVALAVAVPLVALLVAQSGIYNVAASAGHTAWTNWFMRLGMTRSVAFHSSDESPPVDLADPQRIRLGAAHFQGGCVPCHGAPGSPINPVFEHMLPSPPDLARRVPEWQANELFWIVRHGLKYAGMPSWSGGDRPDEIWSVVAFLRVLPDMKEEQYEVLAAGNSDVGGLSPVELVDEGIQLLARAACDRCHDTSSASPVSNLVPGLAGQSAAYLSRALFEYREGTRPSGIMQPIAAELGDAQIKGLAEYYGSASGPSRLASPPEEPASPAVVNRGEGGSEVIADLVYSGNRQQRIPACIACHGEGSRGDYPKLGGQSAAYLAQQLRLWQRGGRNATAWGSVMATVAEHLDEEQVSSVSEWFAAQAKPQEASP